MKVAVIGLGYVGLPLANALDKHFDVTGYDTNYKRVSQLLRNEDVTGECDSESLRSGRIKFTWDPEDLKGTEVFFITVPTPIDQYDRPNMSALEKAAETVGLALGPGSIVVLESTVYPGTTEEVMVPILARSSGLQYPRDFKVGYSPERINPGDKQKTLQSVTKVVSGTDEESVRLIESIYSKIIACDLFVASSIEIAEASKIIENVQRDVNIALINEFKIFLDRRGVDIHEVLSAASTKWNFNFYEPGLVGGHCIGVDPYYLSHAAKKHNVETRVLDSARVVNSKMAEYEAINFVKKLPWRSRGPQTTRVLILGGTFKENCPDIRNSQTPKLAAEMRQLGVAVDLMDPYLENSMIEGFCVNELITTPQKGEYSGVFIAIPHDFFKQFSSKEIRGWCCSDGFVYDLKNKMIKK